MPDRIVLSRSQYLYLTAFMLLLLPLILIAAAPGVADNLWCEHVEMEEYEKALGFSYGPCLFLALAGAPRSATDSVEWRRTGLLAGPA